MEDYKLRDLRTSHTLGWSWNWKESRKIKKDPPKGREGVYDENWDFLEKRPIGGEKNRNYIGRYSLEFRRTTSGSMPLGSP